MDSTHSVQAWIGNVVSGSAIIGSLLGLLPSLAAIVALIWYLIQIYESATVQHWRAGRRVRKLARLKAEVLVLEARDHAAPPLPQGLGDHSPNS